MSLPVYEQEKLTMEEMNLVLRALEWGIADKNNPDGIRRKMDVLREKLEDCMTDILESLD